MSKAKECGTKTEYVACNTPCLQHIPLRDHLEAAGVIRATPSAQSLGGPRFRQARKRDDLAGTSASQETAPWAWLPSTTGRGASPWRLNGSSSSESFFSPKLSSSAVCECREGAASSAARGSAKDRIFHNVAGVCASLEPGALSTGRCALASGPAEAIRKTMARAKPPQTNVDEPRIALRQSAFALRVNTRRESPPFSSEVNGANASMHQSRFKKVYALRPASEESVRNRFYVSP